ncbi:HAD family hydrolase [Dinghuibacter silviterrae]|uniref:Putative hydrolase of the HAD superfamily n=1 Tax=Dinghuibacter silviterrae TaxID=1539049 RepID=A0A4R8DP13_9BACT|nr:HAD family phosphatase [Dinghuibacter silviterrae]TDW99793.1 putative hydrolase of the HAD superfamily [Dinghuibacter silviterrae]
MPTVKNLILDLGGVLLNLDYNRTKQAFRAYGVPDFDAHYTQFKGSTLFDDLETGKVSNEAFYRALKSELGLDLTDDQIKAAWNAMLLDFPVERIEFLKDLRTRYRLFLLSNTNAIHYEAFQKTFREASGKHLDDFFDKAYYSHLLGLRKPGPEPYQAILDEQGLKPEETLFVDDTLPNLAGAREVGMQVIHLQAPATLEGLGL